MEPIKDTFIITQEITNTFAQASGDFNPMHVDTVAARRYQYGSTVIHGINGLLKALDIVVAKLNTSVAIKSLKVQFNSPVRHDDTIELRTSGVNYDSMRIELFNSGKRTQAIDVEFIKVEPHAQKLVDNIFSNTDNDNNVQELDFAEAESLSSDVDLIWDSCRIKELFPHLYKYMPHNQMAVLIGTTNIVGAKCPGLHSVYIGLQISFDTNVVEYEPVMKYTVSKHDSRFSLVTMSIVHDSAKGEIEALFRPEPIEQPNFTSIGKLVESDQFKDQHALIVGGSRGVGEITAKLIASGGGYPLITYAKGKDDANRVAEDIIKNGGKCDALMLNVLSPELDIDKFVHNKPLTHIYYFASPLIEKSDAAVWSEKIFRKFTDFYISGLADLLELFIKIPEYRKSGLTVFIPSTIYLDEPQKGFAEYIAAKAATEAFIKQFAFKYPAFKFIAPRLPRMMTDQTSGVANDSPLHAAEIMVKAIDSSESGDR